MKTKMIIATVLAAALTAASALPTLAEKNNGNFVNSVEFNNAGGVCATYANYYSDNLKKMSEAKTKEAYATARENANWAINKGFGAGCGWINAV
jgi:hypothetical protein